MGFLKWTVGVVGTLGALAGVLVPKGTQAVEHQFDIWMTPPTMVKGLDAILTCGWHGECWAPPAFIAGNALDWRTTQSPMKAYFRGYAQLESHADDLNELTAKPVEDYVGPQGCDRTHVQIWEDDTDGDPAELRAKVKYTHIQLDGTTHISIKVDTSPEWFNEAIGTMTDDAGCGTGLHVHEDNVDVDEDVDTTLNTAAYADGDDPYCPGDCGTYRNDNVYLFTRRFEWTEEYH